MCAYESEDCRAGPPINGSAWDENGRVAATSRLEASGATGATNP